MRERTKSNDKGSNLQEGESVKCFCLGNDFLRFVGLRYVGTDPVVMGEAGVEARQRRNATSMVTTAKVPKKKGKMPVPLLWQANILAQRELRATRASKDGIYAKVDRTDSKFPYVKKPHVSWLKVCTGKFSSNEKSPSSRGKIEVKFEYSNFHRPSGRRSAFATLLFMTKT